MLSKVIESTDRFMHSVPKDQRKKYGQFFTNMGTAEFMVSLFNFDMSKQSINVLDAGAGTGADIDRSPFFSLSSRNGQGFPETGSRGCILRNILSGSGIQGDKSYGHVAGVSPCQD